MKRDIHWKSESDPTNTGKYIPVTRSILWLRLTFVSRYVAKPAPGPDLGPDQIGCTRLGFRDVREASRGARACATRLAWKRGSAVRVSRTYMRVRLKCRACKLLVASAD